MSTITTKDGTRIFYKDFGSGQPVVFSHGWPLSADAWDGQMVFLGQKGFRVVAHDRRSHGRSDQTWDGNDMDRYADDLAELIEKLDLKNIILVGHSTGGGEVTHYVGRHGTGRVAKVVLVGAVPPLMLKTSANPAVSRWRSSMAFANARSTTARNSTRSWRRPSTVSIAMARRSRMASATASGSRA